MGAGWSSAHGDPNGVGRITLINAPPSPYGRKVAIALIEKGIDYDVHYDTPWGQETCTPQYSPLEQLPILLVPGGKPVYDSSYILSWLEIVHPLPRLLPENIEERIDALHRQMLGERLMEVAQAVIFEHHRADPSMAWIDRQTRKIVAVLAVLEQQYGVRVVGPDRPVDLGDIAIATTLLILEYVVPAGLSPDIVVFRWRQQHPNLARAVTELERRPSFASTRPRPMEVDIATQVGS